VNTPIFSPDRSEALDPSWGGTASRLRLLQLASQALPTGAFAYSSGLESLHQLGHLNDEQQCVSYLGSLMETVVVHLELPLFLKMRSAFLAQDQAQAAAASAYLLASRESMEFQEQERQMGRALHRVLSDLHPEYCLNWTPVSFSEALAAASCLYHISDEDAALLLVYTWLEQQVSALCRLIPLGPIAGQRVIDGVLRRAPRAIERGTQLPDHEIGASAPQLALASAYHETQYTRIFRS
jgi:urease accessory protein